MVLKTPRLTTPWSDMKARSLIYQEAELIRQNVQFHFIGTNTIENLILETVRHHEMLFMTTFPPTLA